MDRVTGDRMGMLATVMNGLALAGFLTARNVPCSLYSAQAIAGTVAGYDRDEALAALDANRVVIVAGGTGNPYFTTDTAACLRAVELGADAVLKATTVDGVYNADPKIDAAATKYDTVTYDEVLARELGVMDLTAIVLCKEHDMPLVVFDFAKKGALVDIANGATVGTRVVSA
jgi:uridylate kinase